MKAVIEIQMDNAAFEDHPEFELMRILAKLTQSISDYGMRDGITLRDFNGNSVGSFRIEEE